MNKEIQSLIHDFREVLSGEPWYGRSVYAILDEIDPSIVYKKPNENSHSLIELIYHSLTWAAFTLKCLEHADEQEISSIKQLDWREINPAIHVWEKAVATFKATHEQIIQVLETKTDDFLEAKVNSRNFNFRVLLNGLLDHDIYHLGQIAYVKKLLS